MNSHEIGKQLGKLIGEERSKTNEVLQMINVALEKRAYLDLGFPSMFEWLTKEFGYSNAAAYRRIEAARLLKSVPEISKKLETGDVNLSTLSQVQSFIKSEDKLNGVKIQADQKLQIIQRIQNKSTQDAEKTLCSIFPDSAKTIHQEKRFVLNETTTRHSLNFDEGMSANLKRLKEVLSHKFPAATDAQILAFALEFAVVRLDPLKKSTSAAEAARVKGSQEKTARKTSVSAIRRSTLTLANGKCVFRDPVTGKTCGSGYQIQIDHIKPKALGGKDDAGNLRMLCRQHNLLMAERSFGKRQMAQFRKPIT